MDHLWNPKMKWQNGENGKVISIPPQITAETAKNWQSIDIKTDEGKDEEAKRLPET